MGDHTALSTPLIGSPNEGPRSAFSSLAFHLCLQYMFFKGLVAFDMPKVFVGCCSSQDSFYFNKKPESKDVVEGSETKLDCDVSDRRHIAFQWLQGGQPLQNTSRKYQEDSNLRILRVTRKEDEGPFSCIATNVTTEFSITSQEAYLNIQCKYKVISMLYFS
ncbi:tyrosine protein kinase like otk like [Plakobranchus ocellatus]|uniref:Tyrosine protein kinase like otk like n=1 Tax=Plakobranchus ocellatus TaxID=259542 RepID=A0AAV4C9A2_9GAST|nr:tyrosine protein kinase like otk like [Plakobranchus ocellatus]